MFELMAKCDCQCDQGHLHSPLGTYLQEQVLKVNFDTTSTGRDSITLIAHLIPQTPEDAVDSNPPTRERESPSILYHRWYTSDLIRCLLASGDSLRNKRQLQGSPVK